ncbi:ATP-binding protein [Pendulispora rubella]|uniref:histidine kinase n=1 Tax=Pendulispora rubella TaxID=2741070 RepID=A0ABZ2L1D8_9BACT
MKLPHDARISLTAFLGALPGAAVALAFLAWSPASVDLRIALALLIVVAWVGAALAVRARVMRPLRTMTNLVEAIRVGDFSLRGTGARGGNPLGELMLEINALGDNLREGRLAALEADALVRIVLEQVDVAIFAFDGANQLRLVNRAGALLLGAATEELLGRSATKLGIAHWLRAPNASRIEEPRSGGTWQIRKSVFRRGGIPHELLVLTDVKRVVREEERQAFERLVRVLSHEINNSLAPIQSIAHSQRALLARAPRPADWEDDVASGLEVIARRAEGLGRFLTAYAQMAQLPPPRRDPVDVAALVQRVAELETRLPLRIARGPDVTIAGDADQLEQLLINLVRNAVDAAAETRGEVAIRWDLDEVHVILAIADDGRGLASNANLFVPFFTTKRGGTGIGLALSRQIAEAHGGELTLTNRTDATGCIARLHLPRGQAEGFNRE